MLDLKFIYFCLISSSLVMSKKRPLLSNMIKISLCPMLLKRYHHLHTLVKFECDIPNQFKELMKNITYISLKWQPMKEFTNREFLIFMNAKYIKCPLQWWEKHKTMFHTIGFLACQILKIVEKLFWHTFIFQVYFFSFLMNEKFITELWKLNVKIAIFLHLWELLSMRTNWIWKNNFFDTLANFH
jgi:hypothetical protein